VNRQLQRVRRDREKSGKLVFTEPKNASRRAVGLPQRAVSALKSHRKRQREEKLRAGTEWRESGLVFANLTGGPVEAQNVVNRFFKPLLVRAGLPPIRFHDLRHSCLSLLAQRGEPIRDLQALAGHATAAFTLQRYTHHYDASAGAPPTRWAASSPTTRSKLVVLPGGAGASRAGPRGQPRLDLDPGLEDPEDHLRVTLFPLSSE